MIKTTLFAAAAALATVATATPVLAADVTVTYKDLDLKTPAGQQALTRRLDRAAREACGIDAIATGTRVRSSEAQTCYDQAKARNKAAFASLVDDQHLGG